MGTTTESSGVGLDSATLDQLNNAEARALLDTVDSLRLMQVGDIIDLPQIIVVGDQSSGKSSVLEAISHVRFPAKVGLCTRFATELVLRRASWTKIDVSIRFADDGIHQQHREQQPWRRTGFDKDALPEVIKEAEERMGLRSGDAKDFSRDFSKDVLRVEITSPDVYPLTLVDLPGFFHSETARQTRRGKEIVDQLVEGYMRQKNSIILAVVSASNQLANQKVLEETKRHDPTRERTLGVVTKPDLAVAGSSDEQDCIQLVSGQEKANRLALGWHVLRNRSPGEEGIETDQRDANEERFFKTSAWASIARDHRGAEHLRQKLSRVLLAHIQQSLPRLVTEIEESLRPRRVKLEQLGRPRTSREDLRSYLLGIAEDFQRLARDAVDGRYTDGFFGGLYDETRKLRARLRNLNRAFGVTLAAKGAKQEILRDDDGGISLVISPDGHADRGAPDTVPEFLRPFLELYAFPDPEPISASALNNDLELLASANQGREFPGTPNADLAVQLFMMQAEPWRGIGDHHLRLVAKVAKDFVDQLFGHIVGESDAKTCTAILHDVVDPFFERQTDALTAKLDELLRPYTVGFGLPLDSEFRHGLSKRTVSRLASRLFELLDQEEPTPEGGGKKRPGRSDKDIKRMIEAAEGFGDRGEFGTNQVIDMMVTHYEMSLRTFTDNVINLAVENCLVCGIPAILTPRMVDGMDDERLRELAQESDAVQAERETLRREVDILQQGLRKCRQHTPREPTVLPASFQGLSTGTRSASRGVSPSPGTPTPASKTKNMPVMDKTPLRAAHAQTESEASPVAPKAGSIFANLHKHEDSSYNFLFNNPPQLATPT